MLNSILNLTTSQQQDPSEISTTLFQSQLKTSSKSGQNFADSNSDFATQLNQFRQLLQGSIGETGKSLPEYNQVTQSHNEAQMLEKLSQLQQMTSKFEQFLDNQSLDTNTTEGASVASGSSDNTTFRQWIDSISENINQLKSFSAESELALTDQQALKLTEAIEVLQSQLDKVSLALAELPKEPLTPERLQKTIADLLGDTSKALKRVNRALLDNQAQRNVQVAQPPTSKPDTYGLTLNPEKHLSPAIVDQSILERPEKAGKPTLDSLVRGERALTATSENIESLGVKKAKVLSEIAEVKASSRFTASEAETALITENKNKLLISSLKTSDGLRSINNSMSITASPLDAKTLQNLSTVATNSLESSTNIIHSVNEVTSGQNPQSTQIASQSNIQQGLSLRNAFSPNLALRIQWIYQQALSSAEIMMDPPELGPLSVKMQHRGGETNIIFQVNNQQTKEMIEENLPKLKELLQEQGIALGDTQVKQNQQQSDPNQPENSQNANDEELLDKDEILAKNSDSNSGQVAILDAYI